VNANLVSLGRFEVIEILLKISIFELLEEAGLGSSVNLTNGVDELTFIHGVFSFGLAEYKLRKGSASVTVFCESGIG
jgi:hypothetical protein